MLTFLTHLYSFNVFVKQVDLNQCTALLNLVDSELLKILEDGKHSLYLPSDLETLELGNLSTDSTTDAKCLLSFSSYLLINSINKDVYNSTEVKMNRL